MAEAHIGNFVRKNEFLGRKYLEDELLWTTDGRNSETRQLAEISKF